MESNHPNPDPVAPGTTGRSSDASSDVGHFDAHTASIPEVISGGEPEIIPPGQESKTAAAETGWPLWDVQQILRLPFFFLKKRYGELWEIDDEEAEYLAKTWKPLLDKYLPLEETELGTALLVTLAIVGPRAMMTDWEKGKKPTPPASTKTAGSTGSPASSAKENPENQAEWGVFSHQ
jgi:hypothetical protein